MVEFMDAFVELRNMQLILLAAFAFWCGLMIGRTWQLIVGDAEEHQRP